MYEVNNQTHIIHIVDLYKYRTDTDNFRTFDVRISAEMDVFCNVFSPSTAEPCEPPCQNNISAIISGSGTVSASTSSSSAASNAGSTASSAGPGHHSPYDLRRKSPPSHHEAGGSSSCMLPARKRPRTYVSSLQYFIHLLAEMLIILSFSAQIHITGSRRL